MENNKGTQKFVCIFKYFHVEMKFCPAPLGTLETDQLDNLKLIIALTGKLNTGKMFRIVRVINISSKIKIEYELRTSFLVTYQL